MMVGYSGILEHMCTTESSSTLVSYKLQLVGFSRSISFLSFIKALTIHLWWKCCRISKLHFTSPLLRPRKKEFPAKNACIKQLIDLEWEFPIHVQSIQYLWLHIEDILQLYTMYVYMYNTGPQRAHLEWSSQDMGVVNYNGCGQYNVGVVSNSGRLHVEKVIFINKIT